MSITSLELRERQHTRDLEKLNKDLVAAVKKESDALKKVSQLNQKLLKAHTTSQIASYNSQIKMENKKIFDTKKKQSDIQKKISDTTSKLNKTRTDLGKERSKESQKALNRIQLESKKRINEIINNLNEPDLDRNVVNNQNFEHDIFFSYVHEDSAYADPLVKLMKDNGIDVVFDKNDLAWGQSIIDFIDNHLRSVKYGIILLTPTYLNKYWANYELKSLLQRHSRSKGNNIILPIWHNITADEIASHSLALTDFSALPTSVFTQEDIVKKVLELVQPLKEEN